jgi:hypothetical protein
MGITNCPMHNNDSTQCVGLVSTNQDNFLGPHKKHLCQVWLNSVCVTLKILIGRFSRNFFSGTAEGIELKSGIYVPMNVFNM